MNADYGTTSNQVTLHNAVTTQLGDFGSFPTVSATATWGNYDTSIQTKTIDFTTAARNLTPGVAYSFKIAYKTPGSPTVQQAYEKSCMTHAKIILYGYTQPTS